MNDQEWASWMYAQLRGERTPWDWNVLYYPFDNGHWLCCTRGWFGTEYDIFYLAYGKEKKGLLNAFSWPSTHSLIRRVELSELVLEAKSLWTIDLRLLSPGDWEIVQPVIIGEDRSYQEIKQEVPYVLTWGMIEGYVKEDLAFDLKTFSDWKEYSESHSAFLLTKDRFTWEDEMSETKGMMQQRAYKTENPTVVNLLFLLVAKKSIAQGAYLIGG